MVHYVDKGTQTKWAGIMQHCVRADTLSPRLNTTTPPDDMLTEKPQNSGTSSAQPQQDAHNQSSPPMTMLRRRMQAANLGFNPHISLPAADLNDDVPMSPPPTQALLSPLPAANRLHAGHTPLNPGALSPRPEIALEIKQEREEQNTGTPDRDEALTGPLTLPTNPVDGADDRIALEVLDHRLDRFARQQAVQRGEDLSEESTPVDSTRRPVPQEDEAEGNTARNGASSSRKGSADSHRSGASEEFDGVILKTPRDNFGAPLGSL